MKKNLFSFFASTMVMLICFTGQSFGQALSATISKTDSECPSTGSITVNATGGVLPYVYSITSGPIVRDEQTSNVFDNVPAGNYTITVKDSTNATLQVSTTINSTYVAMNPTLRATAEYVAAQIQAR